jgi:hypothetical protein
MVDSVVGELGRLAVTVKIIRMFSGLSILDDV